MASKVKLHTVGQILAGEHKGWFVFVQTVRNDQGFYIFTSNNKSFGKDDDGNLIHDSEGFDDWVPEYKTIQILFDYRNWEIEWLPDDHPDWLEDVID